MTQGTAARGGGAILTGLDLPHGSPGGSVELLHDLYLGPEPLIAADVFMLGDDPGARSPVLLDVPGKQLDGPGFWAYVGDLADAIRKRFPAGEHGLLHLQHLAFGATPALLRAFPDLPSVALVHGTDLLFAMDHPSQEAVLREAVAAAHAIVVPTAAMAGLLPCDGSRVVHIPWGIPDHLLTAPPERTPYGGEEFRVLYAGRLTDEKGGALLEAVAGVEGVRLSVAAPVAEYRALERVTDMSGVRYLGWLTRPELWRAFAQQDLLVVPSTRLEAFGLVAVEAQACGLPVLHQPVPGLAEVLGDSALTFSDRSALPEAVMRLAKDGSALDELRAAGFRNAARFPLSRTARELRELSDQLLRKAGR
ncbi:glycosyltransferase family 4 protein [Nonomuraea sp. NPDC049607]|uniref:glycosyltransferase family 4 protein n=1 Tax=unclassified Nonomuraea TaxID=2593643 RepID=UPI0034458E96